MYQIKDVISIEVWAQHHNIMGCLDRYLREHDYQENIQHLAIFKSARDMVKAKRSFLKSIGNSNCPNKAQAFPEQEIEILWTNNGFNYHDADCLYSAIWFLLALNFGLRGSHECRQLSVRPHCEGTLQWPEISESKRVSHQDQKGGWKPKRGQIVPLGVQCSYANSS